MSPRFASARELSPSLPLPVSLLAGVTGATLCAALTLSSRPAAGQSAPEGAPAPSSAARAPYSLPFQQRPVIAASAIRSDTSFGAYENTLGQKGFAVISELSGSWRVPGTGSAPATGLTPFAKFTVVGDAPPGTATGGFAFVNPLVGAWYAFSSGSGLRASAFAGVTIPVGEGGGDTPNKGQLDARAVGPVIRAGMDNTLFAVNDVSLIPGFDIAYVADGLTLQAEANLCELLRVRGAEAQLEASRTAFTGGVHAGYFVTDFLSIGVEFRIQWWLDPPFAVESHKPNTSYDLTSVGVGPRLHFKLGPDVWIRPGVAFTRGFDPPMTPKAFNDDVVQLDVPVVF